MSPKLFRGGLILLTMSIPVLTGAGESMTYDLNHMVRSVDARNSTKCSTAPPSTLVDALCRSDTKAICSQIKSSSQPSSQSIREKAFSKSRREIADLSVAIGKVLEEEVTPQQVSQVVQKYTNIVKSAYDAIGAEYLARGKRIQDVESRVALLKMDLLARVEKYPSFRGTNAKDVVKEIKLVTPANLEKANVDTILSYFTSCGVDGLADNAFYLKSAHSLVVCPGSLLTILRMGGRPDMVDDEIGHELGHSVGPDKLDKDDKSFRDAYNEFKSCLDSHDGLEFASLTDHLNLYKKRIPNLESCLDILNHQLPVPPQDKIAQVSSRISSYKSDVEGIHYISQTDPSLATDAVASHIKELAADFMGAETMADKITGMPIDQRARYVATNLKTFCSEIDPMVQEIYTKDCVAAQPQFTPEESREWWSGDDGRHPSDDYRVRALMHHPGIRRALGCQALPVDEPHPWCSLSAPKSTKN